MPLLPWQPQLSLKGLMARPPAQFLQGRSCGPWGWDECQGGAGWQDRPQVGLGGWDEPQVGLMARAGPQLGAGAAVGGSWRWGKTWAAELPRSTACWDRPGGRPAEEVSGAGGGALRVPRAPGVPAAGSVPDAAAPPGPGMAVRAEDVVGKRGAPGPRRRGEEGGAPGLWCGLLRGRSSAGGSPVSARERVGERGEEGSRGEAPGGSRRGGGSVGAEPRPVAGVSGEPRAGAGAGGAALGALRRFPGGQRGKGTGAGRKGTECAEGQRRPSAAGGARELGAGRAGSRRFGRGMPGAVVFRHRASGWPGLFRARHAGSSSLPALGFRLAMFVFRRGMPGAVVFRHWASGRPCCLAWHAGSSSLPALGFRAAIFACTVCWEV